MNPMVFERSQQLGIRRTPHVAQPCSPLKPWIRIAPLPKTAIRVACSEAYPQLQCTPSRSGGPGPCSSMEFAWRPQCWGKACTEPRLAARTPSSQWLGRSVRIFGLGGRIQQSPAVLGQTQPVVRGTLPTPHGQADARSGLPLRMSSNQLVHLTLNF